MIDFCHGIYSNTFEQNVVFLSFLSWWENPPLLQELRTTKFYFQLSKLDFAALIDYLNDNHQNPNDKQNPQCQETRKNVVECLFFSTFICISPLLKPTYLQTPGGVRNRERCSAWCLLQQNFIDFMHFWWRSLRKAEPNFPTWNTHLI